MFQPLFVFRNTRFNSIKFSILLVTIFCSNFVPVRAQVSYPVPAKSKDMLFYLQRTFNRNTIVFELNRKEDNTLDLTNPVKLHWIRYEENSQDMNLTKVQRMIFGFKCIPTNKTNTSFLLVNKKIDKLKINLEKTNSADYKAFMKINNQKTELESIFIRTEENGLGMSVKVKYVEVTGISTESKKRNSERILP